MPASAGEPAPFVRRSLQQQCRRRRNPFCPIGWKNVIRLRREAEFLDEAPSQSIWFGVRGPMSVAASLFVCQHPGTN
jgi:hypothetical protein